MNKSSVTAALTVSLGGFVFGYDLGALSSVSPGLRAAFGLSASAFGLTVSAALWGTVVGSLAAGWLADRVGRRTLIATCALLYMFAAVMVAAPVSREWHVFLAMRFLCGISIGGFTVGCPLYLSELALPAYRGRFVSLFQLQVGAGVVIAFAVGSLMARVTSTEMVWRWCLGGGSIPSAMLLLALPFVQVAAPDPSRARELGPATAPSEEPVRNRLFRRKNLRPLLLATSIAIFNQLSGVNILLLYMLEILASAGIGLSLGHTYTVLISCLGLAMTLIAMTVVDKLGRRPLLLIGASGMGLCLFALGFAVPRHLQPVLYLSILIAYNAFFAFSQGTVVWVYLSELFPPGIRGSGQGYGASVHWITNALLVALFPVLQRGSSVRTFYFFGLVMILQIAVVWVWYPETQGTHLGLPLKQS